MVTKIVVIVFLLTIVYALGSSFWFLIRDKGEGKRTVRRLTWRVGLSLFLFLLIMLAVYMGWLKPGTPGPVRFPAAVDSTSGDH